MLSNTSAHEPAVYPAQALDRFKKEPNGVLVATDVAARGLDVPDVRCVVSSTPLLLSACLSYVTALSMCSTCYCSTHAMSAVHTASLELHTQRLCCQIAAEASPPFSDPGNSLGRLVSRCPSGKPCTAAAPSWHLPWCRCTTRCRRRRICTCTARAALLVQRRTASR